MCVVRVWTCCVRGVDGLVVRSVALDSDFGIGFVCFFMLYGGDDSTMWNESQKNN